MKLWVSHKRFPFLSENAYTVKSVDKVLKPIGTQTVQGYTPVAHESKVPSCHRVANINTACNCEYSKILP